MSERPGEYKPEASQPPKPQAKPNHIWRRVITEVLIILAFAVIVLVIFAIDTERKESWLYRQSAYIDTLYQQEDRLLQNMETFVAMLPPQRTDWSEADKAEFDKLNNDKLELYNLIDQSLMEYNVNLALWSKPLFENLELPWTKNPGSD